MGYSIMTKNYHYVEWYTWDNDLGVRGNFVTSELYDRREDPEENINIADVESNRVVVDQLSTQLVNGWRNAMPPN